MQRHLTIVFWNAHSYESACLAADVRDEIPTFTLAGTIVEWSTNLEAACVAPN